MWDDNSTGKCMQTNVLAWIKPIKARGNLPIVRWNQTFMPCIAQPAATWKCLPPPHSVCLISNLRVVVKDDRHLGPTLSPNNHQPSAPTNSTNTDLSNSNNKSISYQLNLFSFNNFHNGISRIHLLHPLILATKVGGVLPPHSTADCVGTRPQQHWSNFRLDTPLPATK